MAIDSAYDAVLQAAVKGSLVDYAVVAKERAKLDAYLGLVAVQKTHEGSADVRINMQPDDLLAAYINAYNAIVLAAFLDHGKTRVIDAKGFFDAEKHKVFGEELTLNELEQKHIRLLDEHGLSRDPRVHFAVNCASRDCPPLAAHPYEGPTLSKQLDQQTRAYLSRAGEVFIDENERRLVVVQLFEWYASDFGGETGVRRFIERFRPDLQVKLRDETWDLDYRPYDWSPNAA